MLTNTHVHSSLWTHAHIPYPYDHLRITEPTDLEVDEVTTGASLLTGTSPTTERIAPDNSRINPRKCKRPCQVQDLNLMGWFHHTKPNHQSQASFALREDILVYNLHQFIPPLSEGNPLNQDLGVIGWPPPLFFLFNSSISFVVVVGFEREGFEHVLCDLALHHCIVLSSQLRFVRVRDRELVTLGGWPPSWFGGWCRGDLFVEDCEEARDFPSWDLWKWLWSLSSWEWRKI
jgi:hypothetical protein